MDADLTAQQVNALQHRADRLLWLLWLISSLKISHRSLRRPRIPRETELEGPTSPWTRSLRTAAPPHARTHRLTTQKIFLRYISVSLFVPGQVCAGILGTTAVAFALNTLMPPSSAW
jgi:hypothetical protein